MFVEKLGKDEAADQSIIEDFLDDECLETVTIEEQPRRPPVAMVSCVRTVSPIVRQLKNTLSAFIVF